MIRSSTTLSMSCIQYTPHKNRCNSTLPHQIYTVHVETCHTPHGKSNMAGANTVLIEVLLLTDYY